jgi:hypothetical protein
MGEIIITEEFFKEIIFQLENNKLKNVGYMGGLEFKDLSKTNIPEHYLEFYEKYKDEVIEYSIKNGLCFINQEKVNFPKFKDLEKLKEYVINYYIALIDLEK